MKLGIMQPYFFPYAGYFQLMNAVDEFIVYDNIQYTKKGWINRNRIIQNGQDEYISLPLKKDSDYLDVRERTLADSWKEERKKMLNRISSSYRKAPYFNEVFPVIEKTLMNEQANLFEFILTSLENVAAYLSIKTRLLRSSAVEIDHSLRAEQKVIALCKARSADMYINPIGGTELYRADHFNAENIELRFINMKPLEYRQFDHDFIPHLSIIDVMMFNSKEDIFTFLNKEYTLI